MKRIYILPAIMVLFLAACSGPKLENAGQLNKVASLPAAFNFNAKKLHVLTTFINRKQGTMSTLYGNDIAFAHATMLPDSSYPRGTMLTLVTWKQQEDKRWFGASIPGALQSAETIETEEYGPGITYQRYEGADLALAHPLDSLQEANRIKYIFGQKPSVFP